MPITNAQLAADISEMVAYWKTRDVEFAEWLSGAADGGPFADGRFPLSDYNGVIQYIKSPAALQSSVTDSADAAAASAIAAAGAEADAETAQAAAEAARDLALTYRNAAQAARDLALSYRDTAASHEANANTHRTNAATSASAAAGSATDADTSADAAAASGAAAAASAAAADASADDAAASAAAAQTWNPTNYARKDIAETFAAQVHFARTDASGPNLISLGSEGLASGSRRWSFRIGTGGDLQFGPADDSGALLTTAVAFPRNSPEVLRLFATDTVGDVYIRFCDSAGAQKGYVGFGGTVDDTFFFYNQENAGFQWYCNNTQQLILGANGYLTLRNGQYQAPDGTNALPAYSFDADGNLGLYRYGADVLAVSAGGAAVAWFASTYCQFSNDIYLSTPRTTASAANVFMDAANEGLIHRVTSSRRYKKNIVDLAAAEAERVVQALRPITYLSLAAHDDNTHPWFGLIAEEVAEVSPSLVQWTEIDKRRVPDGVQYERLTVLLLSYVRSLEARLKALES